MTELEFSEAGIAVRLLSCAETVGLNRCLLEADVSHILSFLDCKLNPWQWIIDLRTAISCISERLVTRKAIIHTCVESTSKNPEAIA